MSNRKQITVEGKVFKSINEASKYYNVASSSVNRRLNNGWSIEEAFELVERKNARSKEVTLEGITYRSIKEACMYYCKDYDKIKHRLRTGWSVEEAFDLDEREYMYKGSPRPIIIEGKSFESIKEACKYYKMDYDKVCSRLSAKGWTKKWSIEEAFELEIRKDGGYKPVTVEGKTFRSVAEAARYYNMNYDTAKDRINSGWTNEEAFGLVKRARKHSKGKPITVKGKTFNSVAEAARYYNLDNTIVNSRLNIGWSIDEAFEFVPRKRRGRNNEKRQTNNR